MDREILLYALLFSVPPAIGLAGFLTILLGEPPVSPWGLAVGGAVGGALFLLVAKGAGADRGDDDGVEDPDLIAEE